MHSQKIFLLISLIFSSIPFVTPLECPSKESLVPLYLGQEVTDKIRKETKLYAFPDKIATDVVLLGKGKAGCAYALKHDSQILAVGKTPLKPKPVTEEARRKDFEKAINQEIEGLKMVHSILDII
ncbi:hypothetical protein FRC02_000909 [Tulasnella sp. 418]|nr:hypothetical protein FRC02_000909 [Tulasnella sp. 418]